PEPAAEPAATPEPAPLAPAPIAPAPPAPLDPAPPAAAPLPEIPAAAPPPAVPKVIVDLSAAAPVAPRTEQKVIIESLPSETLAGTEVPEVVLPAPPPAPRAPVESLPPPAPPPAAAQPEASWIVIEKRDGEFHATGEGLAAQPPMAPAAEPAPPAPVPSQPPEPPRPPVSVPDSAASEIVEDMLTLMRPRPAPESVEAKKPATLKDAEGDFFQRPATHKTSSAFDDEPELAVRGPGRTLGLLMLVLLLGAALGAGGWYLLRNSQRGTDARPPEPVRLDAGAEPVAEVDAGELPTIPIFPEDDDSSSAEEPPEVAAPDAGGQPADGAPAVATGADAAPEPAELPPIPPERPAPPKPPKTPPAAVPDPAAMETYGLHLAKGEEQYKAGALKAAVAEFQKALGANPNGVEALVALANAYFELDQNPPAIQAARKAIALDPKNARAHLTLGTIYQTLGQNARAIEEYQAYLRLEPNGKFAADVRAILKNLR
ncbi:MAG: tetratricopeptide repeat protein, partial [Myxococcales bacterium]|nr:tetratricopeptide repeat protein [Myxococcales bacterium]